MSNALENVIGQDRAKQVLQLMGRSFHRRKKLPPCGIFGQSGLGKTHLVNTFAEWMGFKVIYINGTAIKDSLAFRAYFKEAAKNKDYYYIVFIDECHNLPRKVQENLLSVLEEPSILCTIAPKEMGNITCIDGPRFIDKGDVMREALPTNMSFFVATTDPAMLKDTVLNRLRRIQLEPYTVAEKAEIAAQYLMGHNVDMGEDAGDTCLKLAQRSRSIRHLKGEICETFLDISTISDDDVPGRMELLDDMLGIDEEGATDMDLDYLDYIGQHKIAGVEVLASILRTEKKDVLTRIEPFLLEKGWIVVTSKGRKLTNGGYRKVFGEDPEDAFAS